MNYVVHIVTTEPGYYMDLNGDPNLRKTKTSLRTINVSAESKDEAGALATAKYEDANPEYKVVKVADVDRKVWYEVTFRRKSDKRKRTTISVLVDDRKLRQRGKTMEQIVAAQARFSGKADYNERRDAGEVVKVEVSSLQR